MKSYLLSRQACSANLVVLALLGVWFVTLAPTVFKGPAGYIEVSGHSMDGTYKTGDLILTRKQDTYDRRATSSPSRSITGDGMGQVIHRITGGNGTTGYTTQGDNNPDPDPWHPTDADVVGKAWHRFEGKAWILHLPQRPWFVGRGGRCPHPRHARARCTSRAASRQSSRSEADPVLVPAMSAAGGVRRAEVTFPGAGPARSTLCPPVRTVHLAQSTPALPSAWRRRARRSPTSRPEQEGRR